MYDTNEGYSMIKNEYPSETSLNLSNYIQNDFDNEIVQEM